MVSMSSLCLSFVCSMSEGATGILDKGAEKYNLTSEPDDDLQVIHIWYDTILLSYYLMWCDVMWCEKYNLTSEPDDDLQVIT